MRLDEMKKERKEEDREEERRGDRVSVQDFYKVHGEEAFSASIRDTVPPAALVLLLDNEDGPSSKRDLANRGVALERVERLDPLLLLDVGFGRKGRLGRQRRLLGWFGLLGRCGRCW